MRDPIRDMFDETATRPDPMDGIMGNGEYDEFERGKIAEILSVLNLNTSGKFLDAGCGIGRNIPVIRGCGFTDIEGVDFSANMLNVFKRTYPDIPVINADLADLSAIEDNRYENALVMYVFIHILDDEKLQRAIAELERVVSGTIVIGQVMDPDNKPRNHCVYAREFFEMLPMFKKKKLDHFYKNYYEFNGRNHDWTNRVSFMVFK